MAPRRGGKQTSQSVLSIEKIVIFLKHRIRQLSQVVPHCCPQAQAGRGVGRGGDVKGDHGSAFSFDSSFRDICQ